MRLTKTYEVSSFKAVGDKPGEFEAIVSVFGNVDLQGDRVMPGAFTKSLEKWRGAGDPIPVIWSHEWGDPFAHIGYVDPKDAEELADSDLYPGGLKVRGRLDVDKPFAKQVYDLMKARRVKEFSFAYDVLKERTAEDSANELTELDIIEVGPTLKGANPDTVSLAVKSDQAYVKDKLAKAAVSEEMLASAMDIDAELAHALAGTKADSDDEAVPTYRVEGRIVYEGNRYDLERPERFACVNTSTGEAVDVHMSKSLAEEHVTELKEHGEKAPTPQEPGALRSHLTSAHEKELATDTEISEMERIHAEAHDDGADHVHEDGEGLPESMSLEDAAGEKTAAEAMDDLVEAVQETIGEPKSAGKVYIDVVPRISSLEGLTGVIDAKAGKVIGAKRVSDLKSRIDATIAEWASEVNGELAEEAKEETPPSAAEPEVKADEPEEETPASQEQDPDAELKTRLDALTS